MTRALLIPGDRQASRPEPVSYRLSLPRDDGKNKNKDALQEIVGERYASRRFAEEFDRLRRAQGDDPSIIDHVRAIREIRGARVVELGAGTGVMTEKLAAEARSVAAFDRSPHMLDFARRNLERQGITNCTFARAAHAHIPLPDGCADMVFAAWALDRVVFDSGADRWRAALDRIVLEMSRLAKGGGTVIIVAAPPRRDRDYHGHLEQEHGFESILFGPVWRFSSKSAARAAILFFLGKASWKAYEPFWPGNLIVPTGIWWKIG
jgi:ubiquinone/menaquinone biosynthesis C-methylase UbiE